MLPRWMGMNGAFATRSPSGAKRAQEKSRRSLMFVLMDVCWSERPIASATLMKRFANSVSRIGSGAPWSVCLVRAGIVEEGEVVEVEGRAMSGFIFRWTSDAELE